MEYHHKTIYWPFFLRKLDLNFQTFKNLILYGYYYCIASVLQEYCCSPVIASSLALRHLFQPSEARVEAGCKSGAGTLGFRRPFHWHINSYVLPAPSFTLLRFASWELLDFAPTNREHGLRVLWRVILVVFAKTPLALTANWLWVHNTWIAQLFPYLFSCQQWRPKQQRPLSLAPIRLVSMPTWLWMVQRLGHWW